MKQFKLFVGATKIYGICLYGLYILHKFFANIARKKYFEIYKILQFT